MGNVRPYIVYKLSYLLLSFQGIDRLSNYSDGIPQTLVSIELGIVNMRNEVLIVVTLCIFGMIHSEKYRLMSLQLIKSHQVVNIGPIAASRIAELLTDKNPHFSLSKLFSSTSDSSPHAIPSKNGYARCRSSSPPSVACKDEFPIVSLVSEAMQLRQSTN